MFRIGDIVSVVQEAMVGNGAEDVDVNYDECYKVTAVLNIGERAYNLEGVDSKSKVFVRDGEEYAFVDDELIRWAI
jgi:hypothetical protein